MSRFILASLIFLAALTALAPPGLCACWLNAEVETYHPHVNADAAETEHGHEYLNTFSQSTAGGLVLSVMTPAAVLIALLALTNIWWQVNDERVFFGGWTPALLLRPPRLAVAR